MANKTRSYGAFYALLKDLPHATKEDLVLTWTSGRTDSLKEMHDYEYESMIVVMRGEANLIKERRKARSSALKLLQRYGIDTTDWTEINRFVSQPKIAGKPFAELSPRELDDLCRKMRSIISKAQKEYAKYKEQNRNNYADILSNYRLRGDC